MSLRYALLALLRVGPMSGYDLQKQFSQSVGHVWHAPDSQIYPELRKWEGELQHIAAPTNPMLTRRLAATSDENRERTIAYKRFAYEGSEEVRRPPRP